MSDNIRVLIADRDINAAHAIAKSLVEQGIFCEIARTPGAALATMARSNCQAVFCDWQMATGDVALLHELKATFPAIPVMLLSSDDAVVAMPSELAAYPSLSKPCSASDLLEFVSQVSLGSDPTRTAGHRDPPPWNAALVHESVAMQELLESVDQVAASIAPVLLVGESGSGKELIARAIHERGARRLQPFVALNASAIPDHLLESELFGHVRGAYTGASQARLGLFGEAQGGTLLLDEIGDMPQALQPKILRILQSGELRAVGSDRTRQVDVRIIAATHRDLESLIQKGQFRDDLRYRLNTLVLTVPPLRERRADIMPLARHFLRLAKLRAPASLVASFAPEVEAALTQSAWPGNVRQLEGVVERLVVMGREQTVRMHDLAFFLRKPAEVTPGWPSCEGRPCTLHQLNRRYFAWVLDQNGGDKAKAAEVLGIDVSTLYRWQRKDS